MAQTLTSLLQRKGIPWRPGKPPNVNVCCPFCIGNGESQDTRFRLGINPVTGQGHCFNCGWRAKSKAPRLLLRRLGIEVERLAFEQEAPPPPEPPERLPEDFTTIQELGPGELEDRVRGYLQDRGVGVGQIQRHRIGVSFIGKYAYRIVFPVYYRKKLRMIVGRDFTGVSSRRYLNSHGEKWLFGLETKSPSRCVLSEGIFKSLALERVVRKDGWGSCAALGHTITQVQIEQLQESGVSEVVVWPDPDKAGRRGAMGICEELMQHSFSVQTIPTPPKQADELTKVEREYYWKLRRPWNWTVAVRIINGLAF